MYLRKIFLFAFFLCFFLSSCTDKNPVSPLNFEANEEIQLNHNGNAETITVMTRNIYVGADVDRIMLTEDPNQIPIVVTEVFQSLLATNFPERAQALANEIYEKQPHLIGLQEVSLLRIQSPGDAVVGGVTPAEDVILDYLEILMMTLSGMGLEYDVVAKIQNADVEMPMVVSAVPEFDDVRLTDYDVILAKRGVEISNVDARNYKAKVTLEDLFALLYGKLVRWVLRY